MGGLPAGPPPGGLWLCFSSGSAPQQQRWAASNSHPEAWAAPQPAPKGADRPGAAEEVASGTSSQQAAKVWLGACQIRVDTNV